MVKEKPIHLPREQRNQVTRAKHRLLTVEFKDFESESRPGKFYRARIEADGKVFCNCQGWTVKKDWMPRRCRHTDELLAGRATRDDGEFFYLKEVK